MPSEVAKTISLKLKHLTDAQQEEVLELVEKLVPPRRNLWEIWQERLKDIPEEELDKIPTDASVNLDHYLYGAPKK